MNPSLTLLLILALIAGAFTWLMTLALCHWSLRLGLVDIPNERSSHIRPTPRGGGLSFVIITPIVTVAALWHLGVSLPPGMPALLLGSLLVATLSLADDRWHLPRRIRLGAHLVGALILMAGGGVLHEIWLANGVVWSLGWLSLPLTLVWLVGLTNAYNFMDGIDGLAAGQAVIAAITAGWLSEISGEVGIALAMTILAGAVLGFLLQNWPPARIFMGDVGSAFLGFTFAGWAVLSSRTISGSPPFLAWVTVLAPFLFDTSITLVTRVMRGQRWYEAHREHFYQQLIRHGWSHWAVTSLYLSIAGFLGLATIAYYGYGCIGPISFIGLVALPLVGIVMLAAKYNRRGRSRPT